MEHEDDDGCKEREHDYRTFGGAGVPGSTSAAERNAIVPAVRTGAPPSDGTT
jgi:hypothetical protein